MTFWTLQLTLRNNQGVDYAVCIDLDSVVLREVAKIDPPGALAWCDKFDSTIRTMRAKEFRRDLFLGEARRLGQALATRMEDSEGWHGVERQEKTNKKEYRP